MFPSLDGRKLVNLHLFQKLLPVSDRGVKYRKKLSSLPHSFYLRVTSKTSLHQALISTIPLASPTGDDRGLAFCHLLVNCHLKISPKYLKPVTVAQAVMFKRHSCLGDISSPLNNLPPHLKKRCKLNVLLVRKRKKTV